MINCAKCGGSVVHDELRGSIRCSDYPLTCDNDEVMTHKPNGVEGAKNQWYLDQLRIEKENNMELSNCGKCGSESTQEVNPLSKFVTTSCINILCGQKEVIKNSKMNWEDATMMWNSNQEAVVLNRVYGFEPSSEPETEPLQVREVLLNQSFKIYTEENGYVVSNMSSENPNYKHKSWVFSTLQDLADFIKLHGPDTLQQQAQIEPNQ